jgi:hypothetical protein
MRVTIAGKSGSAPANTSATEIVIRRDSQWVMSIAASVGRAASWSASVSVQRVSIGTSGKVAAWSMTGLSSRRWRRQTAPSLISMPVPSPGATGRRISR